MRRVAGYSILLACQANQHVTVLSIKHLYTGVNCTVANGEALTLERFFYGAESCCDEQ